MKHIRLLPIAVAAAVFAVGGVTQAFADNSDSHNPDWTPPSYDAQPVGSASTASVIPAKLNPRFDPAIIGGNASLPGILHRQAGDQMQAKAPVPTAAAKTASVKLGPRFNPAIIGGNASLPGILHRQAG